MLKNHCQSEEARLANGSVFVPLQVLRQKNAENSELEEVIMTKCCIIMWTNFRFMLLSNCFYKSKCSTYHEGSFRAEH
jgi:hypothetical protein